MSDELEREGLAVRPRSQWQLFWRKFLRHRLAMVSLAFLVLAGLAAFNAEQVAPYEYDEINLPNSSVGPQLADYHFFGTDRLGRDYFSRVLYGTATSLQVGLIVAGVSSVIGIVVGGVAGFNRGWLDNALMRLTDMVLIVPALGVLLVVAAFVRAATSWQIGLLIAALTWTLMARIVRSVFLSLREMEFVEAARASGAGTLRIMFRHILPNSVGPIIVNATLTVAAAILIEASLSFLGFGVQPPEPALGKLIADNRGTMLTQWWLVALPGATIVALCTAINFVGDGLRDALDPTQQVSGP